MGLIDAGLPPDPADLAALDAANQKVDAQCIFRNVISLEAVLKHEGIEPDDIDFLALTQPITYHSGGLLPRYFPRATVYMARAGIMEFLLEQVGHPPRAFYFTNSTWNFLYTLLQQDRLILASNETEIAPGIVFECTGGHHPGSAALKIETSAGTVGILETAFLKGNIDDEIPIGVAEDAAACRRAIKSYKRKCDIVVAGHDPGAGVLFPGRR